MNQCNGVILMVFIVKSDDIAYGCKTGGLSLRHYAKKGQGTVRADLGPNILWKMNSRTQTWFVIIIIL